MNKVRTLLILAAVVIAATAVSWGAVFVSVSFGPPALPVYAQPLCPAPGYIWVPGYWAWDPNIGDYYWVPGTWVLPPQVGFLWTPGFWGFSAGAYNWHAGYWGPTVGFYGGINYGYGYPGNGYYGGRWQGREFYYNRTVNNVNVTNIHNVYNQTLVNNYTNQRIAYNGGPGGVQARPTQQQLAAAQARHADPTPVQRQHEQTARNDRTQFAKANQGRPAVVATPRAGALSDARAVRANLPASNREAGARNTANNRPVPRPTQRNEQVRPPQNNQPNRSAQVQRPEQNVSRPSNQNQRANQPQSSMQAHNQPPSRPQREVQQAPRQHSTPPEHVNEPPARAQQRTSQPPPETHATARPAAQRPPAQHQAAPPHQVAQQHQAAPPRQTAQQRPPAKEEDRPR